MEKNALFVSDWNNVVFEGRNELVFEDKNKSYGAYLIRKNYNNSVFISLTIGIGLILALSVTPKVIDLFSSMTSSLGNIDTGMEVITLPPPPKTDIIIPPPIIEKPVASTTKFVPPIVKDDAKDDDQIKIQDDLSDKKISTVDVKVDDDDIIIDDKKTTLVPEKKEEPWTIVEEMPTFPGGEKEMIRFIQSNTVYPVSAKEDGRSGTVYMNFVIDTDGNISDVKILKGVKNAASLEHEAARVIKMMPKWTPGRQNGRKVPVSYNLPYTFTLSR